MYHRCLALAQEVVVTRKGQTTIPVELRRKYKIEEGSRMQVQDTGDGILFKPKPTFFDRCGCEGRGAEGNEEAAAQTAGRRCLASFDTRFFVEAFFSDGAKAQLAAKEFVTRNVTRCKP